MNYKLSNILYTSNRSRINNLFNHDYIVHHENYCDALIEPASGKTRYQPLFYQNFALDIITETVFDYPHPQLTEKTFKPIAMKRLFIFVGAAHSLKLLKKFGFLTFSSYINEEYDSIDDPKIRMSKIEYEIEKFSKKSNKEIKEIVKNCSEILEHNFLTLTKLYDHELDSIKKQLEN